MMLYSRFAFGKQFNKSVCRTVALFLAVLLCFSLCACTGKEEEDTGTDETTAAEPDPAYGTVRAEDRDDGVLRVLLDAGHGFGDVGCQSPYGFDEKDLTIIFARLLADELKERGAEVYLTHDGELPDGSGNYRCRRPIGDFLRCRKNCGKRSFQRI